ncbi:MAG: hypothetical protein M5U19_09185 [Microthrixaceae bacterium]|nr:hypothetical protein [Microthrixaceae bacterium]
MAEHHAVVEQAPEVGSLTGVDHVGKQVGVAAVEQEHDHMARHGAVEDVELRCAVLAFQEDVAIGLTGGAHPRGMCVQPHQGRDGGRDVHHTGGAVDDTEVPDARSGSKERCSCLHCSKRAVLAQMSLHTVGGGMGHEQVGGAVGVEELGDRVKGMRV